MIDYNRPVPRHSNLLAQCSQEILIFPLCPKQWHLGSSIAYPIPSFSGPILFDIVTIVVYKLTILSVAYQEFSRFEFFDVVTDLTDFIIPNEMFSIRWCRAK